MAGRARFPAMGNLQTYQRCLAPPEKEPPPPPAPPCAECDGTGKCKECKSEGGWFVEKNVLRNEKRKTPQGNYVSETITVKYGSAFPTTLTSNPAAALRQLPPPGHRYNEWTNCPQCGGIKPAFRGIMSGSSPFDLNMNNGSPPIRGTKGTGNCKHCKGTGSTPPPSPPLARRLFHTS